VEADHPGNLAVRQVLEELYGREPYQARVGGTIPLLPAFLEILGTCTVSFAFGLRDENIHAPDEFFRLSSFRRGQEAYCRLLERLGE
jgi:acetylornithine deacetylase/succinyl-diaminopimelate desuccinylase-like protein